LKIKADGVVVKRVIVTGGAGFIGSEVVRQFITETDVHVINVDKLTYAGNLATVASVASSPRYTFEPVDICDADAVQRLFRDHRPDAVMHLAAESHVDRSIHAPAAFIQTNIIGTYTLLEAARSYWQGLMGQQRAAFRFHHVSTDEVYGSLGDEGMFSETTAYAPNSPYSASKASADHLVRAWGKTYGLPVITTYSANNYGPYQLAEKLIPRLVTEAVAGRPLPVYGSGQQVRDWLHVADHARALRLVLAEGETGTVYNIGARNERTNLEVVRSVCAILDELLPSTRCGVVRYEELIRFVEDRPGHDQRYSIDASKLERELGWYPVERFDSALRDTVKWYLTHSEWCCQSIEMEAKADETPVVEARLARTA